MHALGGTGNRPVLLNTGHCEAIAQNSGPATRETARWGLEAALLHAEVIRVPKRTINLAANFPMSSARAELARRVIETLGLGLPVSLQDAIQLRNWAVSPEDAVLSLAEIAQHILNQEKNHNADAAENG